MKNLFNYATKELSQDAFLRWLIENYQCENEDVRAQCRKLLSTFCGIEHLDPEKISELNTYAQWKKVDVFVNLKYEKKIYCIAIEDKVFSEEHNQLENYNKRLTGHIEWLKSQNKCAEIEIKKIYFKPAKLSEEEKNRVQNGGWNIFDINEILKIFDADSISTNEILNDYRAHLKDVQRAFKTVQKPTRNSDNIDFLSWAAYFNNSIVPQLSQNGYQVEVKKAGQYPYVCFWAYKQGIEKKAPYLEVRSRDCLNDIFQARILCYGVSDQDLIDQQPKLIENIKNSSLFVCERLITKRKGKTIFPKQVGVTENLKAETTEEFLFHLNACIEEYLTIMKDWR